MYHTKEENAKSDGWVCFMGSCNCEKTPNLTLMRQETSQEGPFERITTVAVEKEIKGVRTERPR